jgi:Fe-S-cluster-containing hydrogenase component 2
VPKVLFGAIKNHWCDFRKVNELTCVVPWECFSACDKGFFSHQEKVLSSVIKESKTLRGVICHDKKKFLCDVLKPRNFYNVVMYYIDKKI